MDLKKLPTSHAHACQMDGPRGDAEEKSGTEQHPGNSATNEKVRSVFEAHEVLRE